MKHCMLHNNGTKYNLRILLIYCKKIHYTTTVSDSATPTGYFLVLSATRCPRIPCSCAKPSAARADELPTFCMTSMCWTCNQTMMHNWQINRYLLLIINWILFDCQITAVQLHSGTPASQNLCMHVNFLMALIFLTTINSLTHKHIK